MKKLLFLLFLITGLNFLPHFPVKAQESVYPTPRQSEVKYLLDGYLQAKMGGFNQRYDFESQGAYESRVADPNQRAMRFKFRQKGVQKYALEKLEPENFELATDQSAKGMVLRIKGARPLPMPEVTKAKGWELDSIVFGYSELHEGFYIGYVKLSTVGMTQEEEGFSEEAKRLKEKGMEEEALLHYQAALDYQPGKAAVIETIQELEENNNLRKAELLIGKAKEALADKNFATAKIYLEQARGHAPTSTIVAHFDEEYQTEKARTQNPNYFLPEAVLNRDLPKIDQLLAMGAKADKPIEGEPMAFYLIDRNDLYLLDKLVKSGLDLNALNSKNETPFMYAIRQNKDKSREFLLKQESVYPTKGSSDGCNSLHYLLRYDSSDQGVLATLKSLAEHPFDLSESCQEWGNPMQMALLLERPALLKQLHAMGASVDDNMPNGQPMTHWALEQEKPQLALVLLELGAQIDRQDTDRGNTALHLAVEERLSVLVRWLLKNKAKLNVQNQIGRTPLHLAVQHNSLFFVRQLLEAGASTEIKDLEGLTPKELAKKEGHKQIRKEF